MHPANALLMKYFGMPLRCHPGRCGWFRPQIHSPLLDRNLHLSFWVPGVTSCQSGGKQLMKGILTVPTFVAVLVCGTALAQSARPASSGQSSPQTEQAGTPADPASQAPGIAPGSVIPVELTTTIDAKKAKTGDEVV